MSSSTCVGNTPGFLDIGGVGDVINDTTSSSSNGIKVEIKGQDSTGHMGCIFKTTDKKNEITIQFKHGSVQHLTPIHHIYGSVINRAECSTTGSSGSSCQTSGSSCSSGNTCIPKIYVIASKTLTIDGNVIVEKSGDNIFTFDNHRLGLDGVIAGNVINSGTGTNRLWFQGGGSVKGNVIANTLATIDDGETSNTNNGNVVYRGSNRISFMADRPGIIDGNVIAQNNGRNSIIFGGVLIEKSISDRTCLQPNLTPKGNQSGSSGSGSSGTGSTGSSTTATLRYGGCGEIRGNIITDGASGGFNAIAFLGDAKTSNVINNSTKWGLNFVLFAGTQSKTSILNGDVVNNSSASGRNFVYFYGFSKGCNANNGSSNCNNSGTSNCTTTTSTGSSANNEHCCITNTSTSSGGSSGGSSSNSGKESASCNIGGSKAYLNGRVINNGSGDNFVVFGTTGNHALLNGNVINNGTGNNNIHYLQGGTFNGRFSRNGSGLNILAIGSKHAKIDAVKNIPYIYKNPDAIVLTSASSTSSSGNNNYTEDKFDAPTKSSTNINLGEGSKEGPDRNGSFKVSNTTTNLSLWANSLSANKRYIVDGANDSNANPSHSGY